MKNSSKGNLCLRNFLVLGSVCCIISSCQKTADIKSSTTQPNISESQTPGNFTLNNYFEVVLNANRGGYNAFHTNARLHNAWGLAASPSGIFWVNGADAGLSFVFDSTGNTIIPAVSVPSHIPNVPGNPTGIVFNGTQDFWISGTGKPAFFIFASEDGTLSGWNGGSSAVIVADKSDKDASYKGLAIAQNNGNNFLYATNFTKQKIDVFDKNFKHVVKTNAFTDPNMPAHFAPFGIRNINNMLYVTYARQTADGEDDSAHAGFGYVDVFWPNGSLAKRFASRGTLNSPWGISPSSPTLTGKSAVLIGNFGDGRINVYDWDGNYQGQLQQGGRPVKIDGLWAIDNTVANTSPRQLYFTAGPRDEADGIFGFLAKY